MHNAHFVKRKSAKRTFFLWRRSRRPIEVCETKNPAEAGSEGLERSMSEYVVLWRKRHKASNGGSPHEGER